MYFFCFHMNYLDEFNRVKRQKRKKPHVLKETSLFFKQPSANKTVSDLQKANVGFLQVSVFIFLCFFGSRNFFDICIFLFGFGKKSFFEFS